MTLDLRHERSGSFGDQVDMPSRRMFVRGALLIAPSTVLLGGCPWAHTGSERRTASPWRYFTEGESTFVRAVVARLIPADSLGAGALEAGVDRFIDAQLAGDYGRATSWYMHGPFRLGTEQQGYQLPLTPAQAYRVAIPQVDAWCRHHHGSAFADLPGAKQDDVLHAMERGDVSMDVIPVETFFDLLWTNTQEGFLSDPVYGGNQDFAGWKLIGFPGPRYNYVAEISRFGEPYRQPFVSLGGRQPHREG